MWPEWASPKLEIQKRNTETLRAPTPFRAGDPSVFSPRGRQLTGPSSLERYSETSPSVSDLARMDAQVPRALQGWRQGAVGSRVGVSPQLGDEVQHPQEQAGQRQSLSRPFQTLPGLVACWSKQRAGPRLF